MSELIVIGYDTADAAQTARAELMDMAHEYLVDVADAVVATADAQGKVHLDQMVNLWTAGAAGGAFWGLLVGLIFFNPLLGVAVGAGSGALAGRLTDYGIKDDFMKKVAGVLRPGQAALFLMVRTEASDRVLERLGAKGGHVIRTNLDHAAEEHLRRYFEEARENLVHDQAEKAT